MSKTKEEVAVDSMLYNVPDDIHLKLEWCMAVQWHSMMKKTRKELGITTNVKAYAREIGINPNTLLDWRARKDFQEQVANQQKDLMSMDMIGNMIQSSYRKQLETGDPVILKLFLQYTGRMKEEAITFTLPKEIQEIRDRVSQILPKSQAHETKEQQEKKKS